MKEIRHCLWTMLGTLCLAALTAACGNEDDYPPPASSSDDRAANAAPKSERCEEGQVRECTIDLGTNGGIHSCFTGLQHCGQDGWSACMDTEDMEEFLSAQGAE